VVAAQEAAVWRGAIAKDEFAVFPSAVLLLRERQRYSWFRAAQSAYHLSRATIEFVEMRNRFERVLPDLEDAAAIEQGWTGIDFEPAVAARAQLNWWVTNKVPLLNSTNDVTSLMAEEYSIRYGQRAGDFLAAARFRAEAVKLRDVSIDPDWPAIENLLLEAYRTLRASLERGRAARAGV